MRGIIRMKSINDKKDIIYSYLLLLVIVAIGSTAFIGL